MKLCLNFGCSVASGLNGFYFGSAESVATNHATPVAPAARTPRSSSRSRVKPQRVDAKPKPNDGWTLPAGSGLLGGVGSVWRPGNPMEQPVRAAHTHSSDSVEVLVLLGVRSGDLHGFRKHKCTSRFPPVDGEV